MIFSYVMLDIRSISFWKHKNIIRFLVDLKFLSKAICWFSLQTIHICNLLSHWALSNWCDPQWDSIHTPMIKIMYTFTPYAMLLHEEQALHLSIHKIKLHAYVWHLSLKIASRIWGYAKRKEIKDAYPKKVCHMPRHVKKKRREKIKEAYPKKACHILQHVKKKREEIAPIQKKEREMFHTKEFTHHPPKISTHLHILIKVYDLLLLWIRSLT